MCIIILILSVEKITAASLRIKIPQQYTKTAFSKETGEINRSSGFSNAPFDIIYGDLFQDLKLVTNHQSQ
jgi:hypothetical protein